MTRRLLIDGDSVAKSPTSGRLSVGRLDSAVSFLRHELSGADIRVTLVISHQFSEAMTATQRARLDRIVGGTFQALPDGVHLRDFIVRGADDGTAIVISNNAFRRQRESFTWLSAPGNGRHILARRHDAQGPWEFVEARPNDNDRRTLGEIVGAGSRTPPESPAEPPAFAPIEEAQPAAAEAPSTEELIEPKAMPANPVSDGAEISTTRSQLELDEVSAASIAARTRASSVAHISLKTPSDMCALFGVEANYVLALINRGQGATVERLDHVLEERTRARVVRLLTDDINRYQRRINDLSKIRKVSVDEVKRRARNSHIPMALRPGGDRTSSDGFEKLLDKFSGVSNQLPAARSAKELARRFSVDVKYVVNLASSHSSDRVTGGTTLPKDTADAVQQSLAFELFPFTHKLTTAAAHLGIDIHQARAIADKLSIPMVMRPDGWRLSAGDYHGLMVEGWHLRSTGSAWAPPSAAQGSTPNSEPTVPVAAPAATQQPKVGTRSTGDAGTRTGLWRRLRPKPSKN